MNTAVVVNQRRYDNPSERLGMLGAFLVFTAISMAGVWGNVVTNCKCPVTWYSPIGQSIAMAKMLVGSPAEKNGKV